MDYFGGYDDDDENNLENENRSSYKRLTSTQTAILENFMKQCQHPDEAQRRQLAEQVGLEPKQIKFWFQNKRTLLKNQHERENNSSLRRENERIHNENILIREALKATLCTPCGGPPFPKEEHELFMHNMQAENSQLKKEFEKVSNLLAKFMEKEISRPVFEQALASIESFSRHKEPEISLKPKVFESSSLVHGHVHGNLSIREGMLVNNSTQNHDVEKTKMSQIVAIAMEELVRLVRVNEPFWIKSSNAQDGKYTLHHECYDQVFPKNNHFKGANVFEESSKFSGIVKLNGMQLVDMFLDPVKWTNLFPTIVTKAETIKVLESGWPGNRDGALLLMHEEMHILSPLLQPREFNIIRYCKQVEVGVWMITDVSFGSSQPNTSLSQAWKHPSGCIIREMPRETCLITWVEHVEIQEKIHSHPMYKDFVANFNLYGAENWIKELQRMCERSFSFFSERILDQESLGVIKTIEGRKSVMKFSHRMVKTFCECLAMKGQLEFQQLTQDSIGGVRVFPRINLDVIGQPNGMVVTAATTLSLPHRAEEVFQFLKNPSNRSQWDVLSGGNSMHEIAHISNGHYPGNCISIIHSFVPSENNLVILQESFTSPVGSYIIYAPTDAKSIHIAIRGEDARGLEILPSGFIVCPKDQPNATFEANNNVGSSSNNEGVDSNMESESLLTLGYQILAYGPNAIDKEIQMESITTINTVLSTTIKKIKDALMRSN